MQEFCPDPILKNIVECYWICSTDSETSQHLILADGCIDILFDVNHLSDINIVGTFSSAKRIELTPGFNKIGIRFKPGQFSSICNLNAAEIKDQVVDINHFIDSSSFMKTIEGLGDAREDKISILNGLIKNLYINDGHYQKMFKHIIEKITAAPFSEPISVEKIAKDTGYSRQHLRRLFLNFVGLPLKEFIDITRIRQLAAAATTMNYTGWMHLSLGAGYYDQSHLTHHFKKYVDMTPKQYHESASRMLHFYNTQNKNNEMIPSS